MPNTAVRNDWLTLSLVAGIAAVVVVLYASSIASIVELWENSEYRHGALVLPISAYLLWRVRDVLATVKLSPWWPGIVFIAALVAAWWFARVLDVQVVEQLAAVLLIPATIAALLGLAFFRHALFPLAFLVAAVPMGDGMLPILMRLTADISTGLLALAGVPVFRQGQFFSLPGGNFEVADVCAGLNYLVSGLMVSVLFAYLMYRRNAKRLMFVAVMVVALVIANGIRAFIVMYVASATELRYMAGEDHIWFGWVLFGAVVVAMFIAGARWAEPDDSAPSGVAGADGSAPPGRRLRDVLPLVVVLMVVVLAAAAQRFQAHLGSSWKFLLPVGAILIWVLAKRSVPQTREGREVRASATNSARAVRAGAAVVLVAVLLCAGPLSSNESMLAAPRGAASIALPEVDGCALHEAEETLQYWKKYLPVADFAGAAVYRCTAGQAQALVAGYWGTGAGREAHLLVPTEWRNSPASGVALVLAGGRELTVNELELPGRRVWYWYRVGTRTASTPLGAKLLLAFEVLRSREPAPAAVFFIETAVSGSLESDKERLTQLLGELAELSLPSNPSDGSQNSSRHTSRASNGITSPH